MTNYSRQISGRKTASGETDKPAKSFPSDVFVIYFIAIIFPSGLSNDMINFPKAINGYDPVAYYKNGQALKGDDAFTFQWHARTWYFSSKENRDVFATEPEAYAPQYDGYCAWAMAEARKAETDPEVWKIIDGKLYLNCSTAAYEKWRKDIPGNIAKADMNWFVFADKK